jgi:hypothetical protein
VVAEAGLEPGAEALALDLGRLDQAALAQTRSTARPAAAPTTWWE